MCRTNSNLSKQKIFQMTIICGMILPDRLREIRESRFLTQDQLAEKIGVDKQTIFRWEKGIVQPKKRYYGPLSDALGVKIEDLQADEWPLGGPLKPDKTSVMVLFSAVPKESRDLAFALIAELLPPVQQAEAHRRLHKLVSESQEISRPLPAEPESQDSLVEMARKAAEQSRHQAERQQEASKQPGRHKAGA